MPAIFNSMATKVRVGYSRGTSFIAKRICDLTHADISHAFFLVEDEEGANVYEAVFRIGFRKQSWEEYQKENNVKDLFEMNWPHEQVKVELDKMLGTHYSDWKFLWIGFLMMIRHHVDPATPRFDCVTSVLRIALRFGYSILSPVLSPAELRSSLHNRK